MGDLIDNVASVISQSERRVEVSAQNIANIATPGYKRVLSFEATLAAGDAGSGVARSSDPAGATTAAANVVTDFSTGKRMGTGNPNDLAILGGGFFVVQGPDGPLYTRAGQFHRNADGRLLTTQGYALQSDGGGDLVLKTGTFKVQADGTVMQAGEAVGRIALVDFVDRSAAASVEGGFFSAPDAQVSKVESATIDQGALEASNVSAGAEMVSIMAALRSAQSGARMANLYDDLLGRAITAFGQN